MKMLAFVRMILGFTQQIFHENPEKCILKDTFGFIN